MSAPPETKTAPPSSGQDPPTRIGRMRAALEAAGDALGGVKALLVVLAAVGISVPGSFLFPGDIPAPTSPPAEPPVLEPLADVEAIELQTVTFTAVAAGQGGLDFALRDSPTGARITPAGGFTWRPAENQGPGVYTFDVVVTDRATGLTDDQAVTIVVAEANQPPQMTAPAPQRVDEGTLLTFVVTARDPDEPAAALTYALVAGPDGARISPDGTFAWQPTEAQGPGTYEFTATVTEATGDPPLATAVPVAVEVLEVNEAPRAEPIVDLAGTEHVPIEFQATATDPDGTEDLAWTLDSGPGEVTGAGTYRWTPGEADGGGSFVVTLVVSDQATPALTDEVTFQITVAEAMAPVVVADLDLEADSVVLRNDGSVAVDMTGWSLTDADNHRYEFPAGYSLAAGATVTIARAGAPVVADLSWGGAHWWNNERDTATLWDADGNEVSSLTRIG